MKKWAIISVVILMILSIAGIITVQTLWVNNAVSVRNEQFDQLVRTALDETVNKIENRERVRIVTKALAEPDRSNCNTVNSKTLQLFLHNDSLFSWLELLDDKVNKITQPLSKIIYAGKDSTNKKHSTNVFRDVKFFGEKGGEILEKVGESFQVDIQLEDVARKLDTALVTMEDKIANSANDLIGENEQLKETSVKITNVVKNMVVEIESSMLPIEERIPEDTLKVLLDKKIREKGISLDYEYGVLEAGNDTSLVFGTSAFQRLDTASSYSKQLFSGDFIEGSDYLVVQFPGRSAHIWNSVKWLMGGSIVFTLIILITFILTLTMMLRQKKISEIKSDFINNMTHEFKTPIATISLAVDSIENPKVLDDRERILFYSKIIRSENKRMNAQVENVLKMSLIEKKEMIFNKERINVQELLESVAGNISLQVADKNGVLNLASNAENTEVMADKSHLTNVFSNLLDNAIKYSKKVPEIQVDMWNADGNVCISFADKGIGIAKEHKDKVFDRFFRVQTGNVHDVKGFGLGLSYVKVVVIAFGGNVYVESELEQGSTFTITLPIA
ncbi:MAG: HAMP domain-containing histidine kinase [Bacteroidetes bacterium]|nr:HAMP domain-containing histidine kinase [Bacteroidota bacterium]MBU1718051.1 HAMP domain-containing histidine kinase [Bacteroidota bacterium]